VAHKLLSVISAFTLTTTALVGMTATSASGTGGTCSDLGSVSADTTCTLDPGETIWIWAKGGNGGDGFSGTVNGKSYVGGTGGSGARVYRSYTNSSGATETIFVRIGANGADGVDVSGGPTGLGGAGGSFTAISSTNDYNVANLILLASGAGGGGAGTTSGGDGGDGAGHVPPTVANGTSGDAGQGGLSTTAQGRQGESIRIFGFVNSNCSTSDATYYSSGGSPSVDPRIGTPQGTTCALYQGGSAGGGHGYRSSNAGGVSFVATDAVTPSRGGTLGPVISGGGGAGYYGGEGGAGTGGGSGGASYGMAGNSSTTSSENPNVFITAPPVISSLSPTSVDVSGGDSVTVTGSGFIQGLSASIGQSGVFQACTNLSIVSSTQFTCDVPANTAGPGYEFKLTYLDKEFSFPAGGGDPTLTYVQQPSITAVERYEWDAGQWVSPAKFGAGQSITIRVTATNLDTNSGYSVTVGGENCQLMGGGFPSSPFECNLFPQNASNQVAGFLDVVVTNSDGGTATAANAVELVADPTITSVSPTSGDSAGGITITVVGTGFADVNRVTLGGLCRNIVIVNDSQFTCTIDRAPDLNGGGMPMPGMPITLYEPTLGFQDLEISTPYSFSVIYPNAFEYLGPSATSISPSSGTQDGGTSVTIAGSSFTTGSGSAGSSVMIGGVVCASPNVTATQISCTTGASAGTGPVDVVVRSNGADDTIVSGFTYISSAPTLPDPPSITNVVAGNGQATVTVAQATTGGTPTSYTVTASTGQTCQISGSSGSCTVTGLANGSPVTFTAVATNSVGPSASSTASSAVTPSTAPGAPTGVAGTPGNAQVGVTWSAPAFDGGASISDYRIEWFINGNLDDSALVGSSATNYTVTNLTNGTAYTFAVSAINSNGAGSASTPSLAVTPANPPGPPNQPTVVVGDGQATVTVSAGSGGTPSSYTVTASPGGATCTVTGASGSCTVTGLANGTAYTFTAIATNADGTSPASVASASITPSTIPSNVAAPTATRGDQQALLTWTAPFDGGSPITGYKIEVSSDNGSNWTDDTTNTGSSATSYTVNNLTNGTAYVFRITAINANGSSMAPSSNSNAVTPAALPGIPSGLSATHGNGQVALSWTPGASSVTLTGHEIEISTDNGSSWTTAIADTGSALGSATITGLTNGTAYLFRVSGISSAGTGLPLTLGSAVTPSTTPSAATGLSAQVGDQQVVLTWTAGSDGGSAITGYQVERNDGTGWASVTTNTASAATTYTVTGLTNGTSYDFRVTPININGASLVTASGLANQVTPVAAPGVPNAPTAIAGPGSATIAVTAGTGGAPASFLVTALDPNNQTAGACTITGASGSCTITGLAPGTPYTFTATATNANSTSAASNASTPVTPTAAIPTNPPAPAAPGPPSSVTASAGDAAIKVSWTPPAQGGAFAVSMYRATATPGGKTCLSSGTTCTITGLTNGVAYTVSVQALSGAGWGPPATSTAATPGQLAPNAPGVPAVLAGDGRLTVVVSPPGDGVTPTGYVATAMPGAATCTVTGSSGTCVITGLTNGTAYTVTLIAVNEGGSSPQSSSSSSVTPDAPIVPTPELPISAIAIGEVAMLVGGQPASIDVDPRPGNEGLDLSGVGFDMSLIALGADAQPLDLGASGHLVLEADRTARSDGSGFRPATDVAVTLLADDAIAGAGGMSAASRRSSGALVTPREIGLGGVAVDAQGTFSGVFTLPDSLAPGTYTLRVIGLTLENEQRTMFLGVEVVEEVLERPSPVRDVKVSSTARGAISLSWLAPANDGGSAVRQYRIRVRMLGESTYRSVGRTTAQSAVVSGLRPGVRYIVRVRAVNEVGASRSHDRVRVRVAR
jgi:hypothetical protein